MKRALGGSLYMVVGGLVGIASAVASVDYLGASPVETDSGWESFDVASDSGAAFYANAHYLLAGRLPPAPGLQQEMATDRDSDGSLLSGSCSYAITGEAPGHVWWSIATATDTGIRANVASMLSIDTVVFNTDGSMRIMVSAGPSPGNWLRPPDARNFTLIFTAAGERGLARQEPLPDLTVTKGTCT